MVRFRKLRRLMDPVVYFGLSMVAIMWVATILEISNQFAVFANSQVRDATNFARVFEETVLRSVKQIDTHLWFSSIAAGRRHSQNWQSLVGEVPIDRELSIQLTLVGSDGMVMASKVPRWEAKPRDLSDREHIRVHLDKKVDGLFISKPVLGRVSGVWSIQFTRAICNPDGVVIGVAVISVDPKHFARFYDSLGLGATGSVALIGLDGVIRAGGGASTAALGQDLSGTPLMARIATDKEGVAVVPVWGEQSATTAWRRLEGYNLVVAVNVPAAEGLAAYLRWASILFLFALFASVLITTVSIWMANSHQQLALNKAHLKRSQRQILAQSQRLELTLESISQGIAMADARGRVVVTNKKLRTMLSPGQPNARSAQDSTLLAIIANTNSGQISPVRDSNPHSITQTTADGKRLKIVTVTLPDNSIVATFEDVTEIDRQQQQLLKAERAAQTANRAKDAFLATISHEIRTPMHGIIGMSQVLLDTPLLDHQRNSLNSIFSSGEALMTIINDILDYSQIEAGKLELRPAECDLKRLLSDVATLLSARAAERGIAISVAYPSTLPALFQTDTGRLRQIVINLIGNAVKFSTGNRIEVVVDGIARLDHYNVSVAVTDLGPGIPPDKLASIFEEFVQLDAPANRQQSGTGLGLPISKRLAKLLGGTIDVVSEVGVGSTFTLRVPLTTVVMSVEAPALTVLDAVEAATEEKSPPILILAAEDNLTNRQVLCSMLKTENVRIVLAHDGAQAVESFLETRPDIILMDVWMPNMNGFEATQAIRDLEHQHALRRTPIVALTANAVRGDYDKCLAAGMDDYLSKPIYKKVLVKMIDRWRTQIESSTPITFEPLYADDRRQPENAGKSIVARRVETSCVVDARRLAALKQDLDSEGLRLTIIQYNQDMRVALDRLKSDLQKNDTRSIQAEIDVILSCSLNLGCSQLAAACKTIQLQHAPDSTVRDSDMAELSRIFETTQVELTALHNALVATAEAGPLGFSLLEAS